MEDIFSVKNVPWVSEELINFKHYFERYSGVTSLLHGNVINTREDIRKCFPLQTLDDKEDPFNMDKMESACSPDLLFVKDELLPEGISQFPAKKTGRVSNWYAGKFEDAVIPKEGTEALHTLAAQANEHHLRETVADYGSLRNRQLKYFNVVRMMTNEQNIPGASVTEDVQRGCLDDIVINVRVHRPFHKKTSNSKTMNGFPAFSQELLMLGSQKLKNLRDSIICINDHAICEDLSPSPYIKHLSHIATASRELPSGFMYINGVFYNDGRSPYAKDYSEGIKKWAEKRKEIGPMITKKMEDTCLKDLELRLGYPYVFVHLGNCEHILVFTDARLHHKRDVQDPACYPLNWGLPTKVAVKCHICNLYLANWLAKNDPRLPMEYSLLCDFCLKTFCYDSLGKKVHTLKVYPFMDEFLQKL